MRFRLMLLAMGSCVWGTGTFASTSRPRVWAPVNKPSNEINQQVAPHPKLRLGPLPDVSLTQAGAPREAPRRLIQRSSENPASSCDLPEDRIQTSGSNENVDVYYDELSRLTHDPIRKVDFDQSLMLLKELVCWYILRATTYNVRTKKNIRFILNKDDSFGPHSFAGLTVCQNGGPFLLSGAQGNHYPDRVTGPDKALARSMLLLLNNPKYSDSNFQSLADRVRREE
jgi:hypothetical protein